MVLARTSLLLRTPALILFLLALFAPLFSGSAPVRASSTIKINFQSEGAATPTGYLRDYGLAFGARTNGEAQITHGLASDLSGLSYGWVAPGTSNPLNLVGAGRDRNLTADQRLDTLIHMQAATPGAWEVALASGSYDVTVTVGDPGIYEQTEQHTIILEDQKLIDVFSPSGAIGSATRFKSATGRVTVSDGRLTVNAEGGTNTKIDYIEIVAVIDPMQPYVTGSTPIDGSSGVLRNTSITANVSVPGGGIRGTTITNESVMLLRASDLSPVAATVNTTGGGDAITLQPSDYLDPNTRYIFKVTSAVEDGSGNHFLPFSSSFTTGTGGGPGSGDTSIAFDLKRGLVQGFHLSSLEIGPDNRLYVSNLSGQIYRYDIAADGTLKNQLTISTVVDNEGGERAIIGMAFDPASTANNLILWISHNGPYVEQGADDWTGKIARLSGNNLQNFQNYVVNIPHSFKDHMANSLAFGPDNKLYISVGSNSAMGAPDGAWGTRPERVLSGAILRVDQTKIIAPPLDVKTEEGGTYNPYAANAPVTLYANGVRNAYDLVWHSNGELYAPTNGSAKGGNAPGTPGTLPASCKNRIDDATRSDYKGPSVPARYNIADQRDFLFRIVKGGYYGHPNPLRCEWVLNGGNPTSGSDSAEVTEYPVGTLPDRNYRGVAYDFDVHKSPNGAIEYKSNSFDGALKGWLIVVRYSENDDLIALQPGGPDLDIVAARERVQGANNSLSNPLDVIEDTRNGNLYVIEFSPNNQSRVTLLRPASVQSPRIKASPTGLIFTDVAADTTPSIAQTVTIENSGQSDMTVASITSTGANANQFKITGSKPTIIKPGESAVVSVVFQANSPGPKSGILRIATDAVNSPISEVVLRGLGTAGVGGANEPSLQWVFDTYEFDVNAGDDDSSTNVINSSAANQRAPLLGDEISAQRFVRANNANPVTIEPLAVFGPTANNPIVRFGWYPAGSDSVKNELFAVGNSPSSNGQRLDPALLPGASLVFDPGTAEFGFYSTWPFFSNRTLYSQNALNTFSGAIPHHVRVYPLKDSTGALVQDAYIIATEEHTSGFDFQDVVVIARNLRPAAAEPPPPNNPPSAAAGADLTVEIGSSVTLAGSASDPDGDPLTYVWTQTAGPSVDLSNAETLSPSFDAPGTATSLTFKLTVSDDKDSASATVVVSVIDSPINGLIAESDGPTVLGQATTFSARVTQGSGVTYTWTFGDGQQASGAQVSHTYLQAGDYTATVNAQKGGNALNATVAVQVTNQTPIANAGADQHVLVNTGAVLNGSASNDPDGHTPLTFAWVQIDGTPVELSSPSSAQTSFSAPNQADTLVFELTISDAYGLSSTDQVTVVIDPINRPNTAPVARAGEDVRVRVGASVRLSGDNSFDPDGDVLTFAWSQIGGPSVLIGDSTGVAIDFTAPATASNLTFELTVTDAFGKSAVDTVTVVVASAEEMNDPPVANAGPDLRVPVSTGVTLDASNSTDPNGDALSFAWRQVSGLAVSLPTNAAQISIFTPNKQTTLVFEVKVTDAFGKMATDQLTIEVVPIDKPNNAPTASAGPDQRVNLSTVVTLDARGSSDPDGDALSFVWRQVSGPTVLLASADSAQATLVAPSTAASLVFEVTATDAFGASSADRMTLTVSAPQPTNRTPVASAGTAQRVKPGGSVRLDAGTSSDPDNDTLTYAWKQVGGTSVNLVGADTATPSFTAPKQPGQLIFEVKVTDTFGANSTARVTITIASGPSPAPQSRVYLPMIRR